MKKVLIVEDELLARVGIRQLVNWQQLKLELLEDAADGQAAVESIRRNQPDIVLLDLNISPINGLQILDFINSHGFDCKVIVISCNEEFGMVKEAMKAGAFDYLRKMNLSAGELTETLRKCLLSMSAEENETLLKEKTNGNANSGFRRALSYEELFGKQRFESLESVSTVVCIIHQVLSSQGKIYPITDYVKQEMESEGIDYVQIRKGNQYGYFLFFQTFSRQWYQNLQGKLKNLFGEGCYFGIYEQDMPDNTAINGGISMAEQAIYTSFYDEGNGICKVSQKLNLNVHSPGGVHDLLKLLSAEVAAFHHDEAVQILDKVCDAVAVRKYTHLNVLRRIFMDIMGIYSMTAQSLNGSIEEIVIDNDSCHYQKVMMVSSLKEMRRWLKEFETVFFRCFLVRYKCSQSDILRQALNYIEDHLREHIQLVEAAKCIGVSNTYLSTVFKREIGQSFVDYVNQKKTEAGKELLLQGKKVYEVSEMLGFENSTYFSRVFKKYQGIAPDMIRKK